MKRVMTYVMLFINKLKQKQCSKVQEVRLKEHLLDVEKIHNAEKMIVKLVQEGRFGPYIKVSRSPARMRTISNMFHCRVRPCKD